MSVLEGQPWRLTHLWKRLRTLLAVNPCWPAVVFFLYALFTVLIVPYGHMLWSGWHFLSPHPTWVAWGAAKADLDTGLIHAGILQHPRFADTFAWWHGPWVAGDYAPFFRPIPSLAFWLEWRWFGLHEKRYLLLNLACHATVCILFYRVSWQLARRFRCRQPCLMVMGAVLLLFYQVFNVVQERDAVNGAILDAWKNLPDALCALFILLSLSAYLRGIEKQEKGRWCIVLSVLWYVLACCSKEVGSLLPLAFLCLELPSLRTGSPKERKAARLRAAGPAVAMVFFQCYRLWALHGVGYRYGSNRMWMYRLFSGITYPAGSLIAMNEKVTPAIVLLVLAGVNAHLLLRKKWGERAVKKRALLLVANAILWAVLILSLGAYAVCRATGYDGLTVTIAGSLGYVLSLPADAALGSLLGLAIVEKLILERTWLMAFGYAWVFSTELPNIMSPGLVHREYLVSFGFIWMFGYGLSLLLLSVYDRLRQLPWTSLTSVRNASAMRPPEA